MGEDTSSRVKKNTVYNMIRTLSLIVFPFLRFPYLTRVLHPDNFGEINFVNSIAGYVSLFSLLGVEVYAVRECAKIRQDNENTQRFIRQVYSITLLSTLITMLCLGGCVLFLDRLREDALLVFIICVPTVFASLGADWINLSLEDLRFVSLRTLFLQLLGTALTFALVRKQDDFIIYALILAGITICSGISNVLYRNKYFHVGLTRKLELEKHIGGLLCLFALIFSQTIFLNLDITMLGFMRGNDEVGIYSVSCNIYNISSTLVSAVSIVVIPRISSALKIGNREDAEKYQSFALNYILTIGIPLVVGINAMAKQIISLVAGNEYIEGVSALRILSIALLVVMFGGAFLGNIILLPSGGEKTFMFASLTAAACNLMLNSILIPFWGCEAAAVTSMISEIVVLFLLWKKGSCEMQIKLNLGMILKPLIGALPFIFVRLLFDNCFSDSFISIVVEMLLDVLIYFIIQLIIKNDLVLSFLHRGKSVEN